jgi:hypothetical protein
MLGGTQGAGQMVPVPFFLNSDWPKIFEPFFSLIG